MWKFAFGFTDLFKRKDSIINKTLRIVQTVIIEHVSSLNDNHKHILIVLVEAAAL